MPYECTENNGLYQWVEINVPKSKGQNKWAEINTTMPNTTWPKSID